MLLTLINTNRMTPPIAPVGLDYIISAARRNGASVDLVDLALVADAWSRTYRSNATSYAASLDAVVSMNGVRLVPDRAAANWPEDRRVSIFADRKPGDALDLVLDAIAARYGDRTTDVVAMQLEYPRQ